MTNPVKALLNTTMGMALFERSAKGRQVLDAIQAEAEIERLAQRADLAERLKILNASQLKRAKAFVPVDAADQERLQKAQAVVKEASEIMGSHRMAYSSANLADDMARSRLENELRDTASPALSECIATLWKWLHVTHSQLDYTSEGWHYGGGRIAAWSNQQSVDTRVAAIKAAIETAESLKLAALDDAAVARAVADLCDGLPTVEARPGSVERTESAA